MELGMYSGLLRMFLGAIVPLTAVVVGFSLIGALLASFFSFRDEALQYSLRFVGAVLAIAFLWVGISNLFIVETRGIYLYGF